MSKFNEWLKTRDPDLYENMIGRMWSHLTMDPDTGAMPGDEGHEKLLNNELKATMVRLPFDDGLTLFAQAMQAYQPHKQWKPGEIKLAYKRLLKQLGKEGQGYSRELKALHQQQAARLAGK
jgi:hypothetical protein